ncbi:hypothetical protein ACJIZ3_021647 [Penstemon smallii]|uniref:Pathogenesis-related homeodomain protein n=1 Tax=Penstemon smallii TaxID=265156 RepID=A0ABD3SMQ5_9LAMI
MPIATKKENRRKSKEDDERHLSKKQKLKPRNKNGSSLSKSFSSKDIGKERLKKKIVKKAIVHKAKASRKQPSLSGEKDKKAKKISTKESEKPDERDVKRRRRRKKRKNNTELDEASRLQRRTRYLLIKVKVEQNLIDAYSTEGWKGQSREKIRPEKELQRAKKQILECKLGIREAIRQLDLLSSVGCINDSVVAPDGSVHHEHIICAKCKIREAFPNNDIILCDGTCNCAFHQKCLDPPLLTENIPPEGEGWFCKFCKKKMEILEATNAHLGTHFPVNSNWQDVFKEEAALPNCGTSELCPEEEWPSDDSEDGDYDPVGRSCSGSISRSASDGSDCSSSFQVSLEDETFHAPGSFDNSLELIGVDSDEINDEVLCRPRQRGTVDYIKLYDEMFGKNATEIEQISDDEDWGPTKRKRKVVETDAASTLMTLGETETKVSNEMIEEVKEKPSSKKMKRSIFRLPHNATEKLRLAFAENELPERAVRVSLSKQLGLEFEKVNKWFKNARYLALKSRKAGKEYSSFRKEPISEIAKGENDDEMASKDDINITSSSSKILNNFVRRRNTHLQKMKQQMRPSLKTLDSSKTTVDLGDDVSLKQIREKAKEAKKKLNCKRKSCMLEAEAEMKRLCEMKSRVEKLQQVLLELPSSRFSKSREIKSKDSSIIYVPVAEVKEKR